MDISQQGFKGSFQERLLTVHWKQWSALGVAAHIPPEDHWIVDLEALMVSTWVMGLEDKRLFSASLEWLTKNAEWVNFSRLKGIARAFDKPFPGSNHPLFNTGLLKRALDVVQGFIKKPLPLKNIILNEEELRREYESVFDSFRIRDITMPLTILKVPPLLQIYLRSLWGVDARVEVLQYLLFNEGGNTLSIAREVYSNQRNVYQILETWAKTAVVMKLKDGYSLRDRAEWARFLKLKKRSRYWNWTRAFLFFDQVARALTSPPWAGNDYLLSSLFRDLEGEAERVGHGLEVTVPRSQAYPGMRYFEPFAEAVLWMLGVVVGEEKRKPKKDVRGDKITGILRVEGDL
jgi:hypothetical protein